MLPRGTGLGPGKQHDVGCYESCDPAQPRGSSLQHSEELAAFAHLYSWRYGRRLSDLVSPVAPLAGEHGQLYHEQPRWGVGRCGRRKRDAPALADVALIQIDELNY